MSAIQNFFETSLWPRYKRAMLWLWLPLVTIAVSLVSFAVVGAPFLIAFLLGAILIATFGRPTGSSGAEV